jgi:hypothetical protein
MLHLGQLSSRSKGPQGCSEDRGDDGAQGAEAKHRLPACQEEAHAQVGLCTAAAQPLHIQQLCIALCNG